MSGLIRVAFKKQDVRIDSSGKVVIDDPELTEFVKKVLENSANEGDVSGYSSDDINYKCNPGC